MTADLGRIGVWAPLRLWSQEGPGLAEAAAELEELGFGALWIANGPTMLDVASTVLSATSRIAVATGIVNIWAHPVASVAAQYAGIAAQHPERFLLGLGNGPREPAQWQQSPYDRLVEYLDHLDAAGVTAQERLLAAVGPRMLALAAGRSRGAHPFLTTVDHTAAARAALGEGPLLAPEVKVVLESDLATARAIARQALDFYLTKRGYAGNLRRLGFTDDDLTGGGSDRLIDAVVAWGGTEAVRRRIGEYHQAGADHVAVQLLTWRTDAPEPAERRLPQAQYRELAAALVQQS